MLASWLLIASLTAPPVLPAAEEESTGAGPELVAAELVTVGVDLRMRAPVVLLRDTGSERVVPIWVGVAEAQAIARSLHGVNMPRPMTHDLMAELLLQSNVTVEEIVVNELREGTYYGLVRLRMGENDERREVDSRPSDALALALRTGAAIRVAESILEESPDLDFAAPEGEQQVVRTLGITVVKATAERRDEFELPDRPGVLVRGVSGEAREKGLERGDLIVEVNGEVPEEPMDFFPAVRAAAEAGQVELRYWRDGEEHELELSPRRPLRPGEQPDQLEI